MLRGAGGKPDLDAGHVLLLHSSEGERRIALIKWVLSGLERGEQVVCTRAQDEPAHRGVAVVLEGQGIDVQEALRSQSLVVLPLAEFYPEEGQGRLVDSALRDGFSGLRLAAEAATALTYLTEERYDTVEHEVERLSETRGVSALCQYDLLATEPHLMQSLLAHPQQVRERQLVSIGAANELWLSGEADRANELLLQALVRQICDRCNGTAKVDLVNLSFIDVGGARAIATGSRAFLAGGGELVLVGPSPRVAMVLSLVGVDRLPGVHVTRSPS